MAFRRAISALAASALLAGTAVAATGANAAAATGVVTTGVAPLSVAAPAPESRALARLEPIVDELPPGLVQGSVDSVELPADNGAKTLVTTVQYASADAPSGRPATTLYIEAAVSSNGQWRADQARARAINNAKNVGVVGGASLFSVDKTARGGGRELSWLADDQTLVVVGSGGEQPFGLEVLSGVARDVRLAPATGSRGGETTAPLVGGTDADQAEAMTFSASSTSDDAVSITASATAVCSTTCPHSTNMAGSGGLTDDWQDNRVLCDVCPYGSNRGNVVGVWQGVIWANGIYRYGGTIGGEIKATNCDVDGVYGTHSRWFTEAYQRTRGLASDGIVGANTWNKADDTLYQSGSYTVLRGDRHSLWFLRQSYSPYQYSWSWNSSPYYYTGYSGIQMVRTTSNCWT